MNNQELLEQIVSLSKEDQGVSYLIFEPVLDKILMGDIPVDIWHQITNFASDQLSFWSAEWYFSWARSPNEKAKSEMDRWELICRVCLDTLKSKAPTVVIHIEKLHNLKVLRHSLKRAADHNESTLFRRVKSNILSFSSFKLNQIGLHKLSSWLYSLALYPKGTVGRIT